MADIAKRKETLVIDVDERVAEQHGAHPIDSEPEAQAEHRTRRRKKIRRPATNEFYLLLLFVVIGLVWWVTQNGIPTSMQYQMNGISWIAVGIATVVAAACWPWKTLRYIGLLGVVLLLLFKFGRDTADQVGPDMVERNMNKITILHTGQVEGETFAQTQRYHDRGRIDLQGVRQVSHEAASQVAEMNRVRAAAIAESKGMMLAQPPRFLPAKRAGWMPTGIYISDCVFIWGKGESQRDDVTIAGPEGVDFKNMTSYQRNGYHMIHEGRQTFLPGKWGEFKGRTCRDEKGLDCNAPFTIGAGQNISGDSVGDGELYVAFDGFVSETIDHRGQKALNMNDYNVYQGGYYFDKQDVSAEKCSGS